MVRQVYEDQSHWGIAVRKLMAESRNCKSQAALGTKSGVGQTTVGRIIRGDVNPSIAILTSLARALGVSMETFAAIAQSARDRDKQGIDSALNQARMDRTSIEDLEDFRCAVDKAMDHLEKRLRLKIASDREPPHE